MSPEQPIAYVLGTFPQASQTFIAREIRGLKQRGVPLLVFALARRSRDLLEPADRGWYDDVRFVPLAASPAVIAANAWCFARHPWRYLRTLGRLLSLAHRPRVLVVRAFVLFAIGAWMARAIEQAGGCRLIHAHFALAQTEVAMAAAGLLGCPFSFTAHARDIYATPSALEQKIRAARTVVTCTAYNREYLRALCPELPPSHVRLVHHGVGIELTPRPAASQTAPPLILAAGRLIEKKGFDTLIAACARLERQGATFRCRIHGTGPLMSRLRMQAEAEGLGALVDLAGWTPADALVEEMRRAAVFAMPSRVDPRGDRDGIPNVVLEAMATGLPVVATRVSGIPEAVEDDVTGVLVAADDPDGLAAALLRLLADPELSRRLGTAGQARVRDEFALDVASARLAQVFGSAADAPAGT